MISKPIRTPRPMLLLVCLVIAACSCALALKLMNHPDPSLSVVAADPNVKGVVAANTDFGFRLLRQLTTDQPQGNVFFSPFSISDALQMTLNGAGGQTQRDMAQTLGLGVMDLEQINQANGRLLPSLANPDPKVEVSVANALWANRSIAFAPDFRERCRRFYDARAESLDLASPAAVSVINGWVGDKTHGKITRLVSHADIAAAPVVLTNAVYFHGQWQTKFNKAATQSQPFTLERGGVKSVPLMRQEAAFSYLETPRLQAVSLPYGSGRMSLYVLLPKTGQTVEELAGSLDAKAWAEQVARMKPTRLTLFLPRFKAKYEAHLKGPLSALGMASAFDDGADFRPMGLTGSSIDDVIHKALVEVDEEGTVAAAATEVEMQVSAELPPITVMRIDRPFFCAIRDNVTGTILFEGVIRDPEQSQ